MKLTVQKLQSEKGMLEEACVIKDEELQTLQHISDQKLLNLHRFSEKLEAENKSLKNDLSNLNHQINDLKLEHLNPINCLKVVRKRFTTSPGILTTCKTLS